MTQFNPARLDLARRRRGLTKTRLAELASISTRLLAAYERGDRPPTDPTLQKLADAIGFPVAFLGGDDLEEPSVDGVSFRSLSAMTASQRDQAIGAATIAIALDDWLRRRFALPEPDVPRLPDVPAELAADSVRQLWDLGERKAPNMVHLLEKHGVRVFSLVQECVQVDAFSFWRGDVPYVFLNNQKTAERSRMDAAHELGHLVMHAHGGPRGRAAETEAHDFGSAFLMPRRSVLASIPRGATVAQIIKARQKWNVAAMNLAHRMAGLDLLTEWQARTTYMQLTRLGYRTSEPNGIARESSQIFTKVFAALRGEGITRAQIAQELNVSVDEVHRATFGLVVAQPSAAHRSDDPDQPDPPSGPPDLRVVL
jgi:Zn-dependent peptidase ImmA (M78 family)/DNA-binding XRE family transcriptional regulator